MYANILIFSRYSFAPIKCRNTTPSVVDDYRHLSTVHSRAVCHHREQRAPSPTNPLSAPGFWA